MAKKNKKTTYKEKTLAIEDAEHLTVEQVSAKSEALSTENLTKESSLDKYIRQHRSDIEKAKKERQLNVVQASEKLDEFVKTARQSVVVENKTEPVLGSLLPKLPPKLTDSDDEMSEGSSPSQPDEVLAILEKDSEKASAEKSISDDRLASASLADTDLNQPSEVDDESKLETLDLSSETEVADPSPESEIETDKEEKEPHEIDSFPEVKGHFDEVVLATEAVDTENELTQTVSVPDKHHAQSESVKGQANEVNTSTAPVFVAKHQSEQPEQEGLPENVKPTQVAAVSDEGQDNKSEQATKPQTEPQTDSWTVTPEQVAKPTQFRKKPVIIGLCALILMAVGGTAWYQHDVTQKKQADQTEKAKTQKSEAAKKTAAFQKIYATFFLDEKQTKLKNDQFDKLDSLTTELNKLKGQSDYNSQSAKVTELKAEIKVIQNLNQDFDKAVILDGAIDKTAQVKDGVQLAYVATKNDVLNALLKEAITHGQAQQKAKTEAAASAVQASQAAQAQAQIQAAQGPAQASTTTSATTSNGNSSTLGPVSSGYGLNVSQYQAQYPNVRVITSNSRVPVDPNANLNDSAFSWADGIREKVLAKCRERGYISGDDYILLPASIQKGNGYYNLYKSDGTYLVSINCKTGYFVGNAAGHADDLDY